jgi:hypothetical protein
MRRRTGRSTTPREPYARPDRTYEDYAAAYRVGYTGRTHHGAGTTFEAVEPHLRAAYEATQSGMARIDWEEARDATRAAWNRVGRVHGAGSGIGAGPTAG